MRSCWKCIIKLENVLYHIVVRLRKELIPRNVCTLAFPFAAPVLCGNDVIMHLYVQMQKAVLPGNEFADWPGQMRKAVAFAARLLQFSPETGSRKRTIFEARFIGG